MRSSTYPLKVEQLLIQPTSFVSVFLSTPRRRMANSPNAEGPPYSDRPKILVQDSQFFKVIMSPSNQGLKIPDAFMRKYGHDLQHIVFLKVPTGASWQVELVHYENTALLQKGWEEFTKHCCIKMFHFLVFRYQGNSQFLVLIFDPSALEVEYPDSCIRSSESKVSDDDQEFEEISAEILEKSYGTTQDSKGKRARVEDIEEDASIEILGCNQTENSSNEKAKQNQDGNLGCSKRKRNKGKSSVSVAHREKFKSYEKAKAFTSSKPFFISFMQPSYVSGASMRIPEKFARDYLSMKKRHFLMLYVSGRNTGWSVTVAIHPAGPYGIGASITSGWEKFVRDNGLRVGDVCVFELVFRARKFNVIIYRSAEDGEIAS